MWWGFFNFGSIQRVKRGKRLSCCSPNYFCNHRRHFSLLAPRLQVFSFQVRVATTHAELHKYIRLHVLFSPEKVTIIATMKIYLITSITWLVCTNIKACSVTIRAAAKVSSSSPSSLQQKYCHGLISSHFPSNKEVIKQRWFAEERWLQRWKFKCRICVCFKKAYIDCFSHTKHVKRIYARGLLI